MTLLASTDRVVADDIARARRGDQVLGALAAHLVRHGYEDNPSAIAEACRALEHTCGMEREAAEAALRQAVTRIADQADISSKQQDELPSGATGFERLRSTHGDPCLHAVPPCYCCCGVRFFRFDAPWSTWTCAVCHPPVLRADRFLWHEHGSRTEPSSAAVALQEGADGDRGLASAIRREGATPS
ncbi:MAG: hypothetical protein IPN34_21170 [Planctomycetes bacterium]|nr:hypothetical protein [Planctomycetota bacterium]